MAVLPHSTIYSPHNGVFVVQMQSFVVNTTQASGRLLLTADTTWLWSCTRLSRSPGARVWLARSGGRARAGTSSPSDGRARAGTSSPSGGSARAGTSSPSGGSARAGNSSPSGGSARAGTSSPSGGSAKAAAVFSPHINRPRVPVTMATVALCSEMQCL